MSRPPGAEAAAGAVRHTGSTHLPRRRGGLLVATLLVLIAALWATGCAGIGGDGTIHSGLDVGGEDISRVRVSYPGPAAGAGPEQIVRGFVRAGAASDGDYDTARAFLGKNAAKDWSPDGDVVIVSGESDLTIDTAADGSAVLSAPLVATITADGHYVLAAAGSRASVTVTVGQVNGENRITALPTGFGRWVTAADVRRLFQPYAVHYVAVDRRTLVPVLRWFPLDHVTSRLARAQLAPVPADLAGVATTAVVSGTRLSAEAVSVQSGVATVELSQRPPAEQTLRQNLWAQFVATLTQDPTVLSVSLQVDGATIEPPGARAPISDPAQVGFSPSATLPSANALVRQSGRLRVLDPVAPDNGQDPKAIRPRDDLPAIGTEWVGLAVSATGSEVAAVSAGRSVLSWWRGTTRTEVPSFAANLSNPTFDALGYLWVGAGGPASSATSSPAPGSGAAVYVLSAAEATPTARPVAAPWLSGRSVRWVRVSPDGERVAIVSADGQGVTRLDVTGVVRSSNGIPQRLADPVALGSVAPAGSSFTAVVWLDLTSVATLVSSPGRDMRPVLFSLDGTTRELPDVPTGADLTTPSGERQLLVRTADNKVLMRSGPLWVAAGTGDELLVPGR